MFSGEFIKLTQNQGHFSGEGNEQWTDSELLLLLEAIEMYEDDWTAIEEHVGTRSAQQCIRKFLELPIEDPYIAAEGEAMKGPLRYARIPFEQADNPVMSVVAFLSGVVGPGVAADAAKAAIHELADGKKEQVKELVEEIEKEGTTIENDGDKSMDEINVDEKMDVSASSSNENGVTNGNPDAMNVDSSSSPKPETKFKSTIAKSKVVRAAELALKASAKSARALAEVEENAIRKSLAELIKLTLTKLELKMTQFEEMEELLEEERRSLEQQRLQLAQERQNIKQVMNAVRAEIEKNNPNVPPGAALPQPYNQLQGALAGQGTKVAEIRSGTSFEGDSGPVSAGNYTQLI